MRQQDVFKKIGGILQELTEQYNYLKDNPDLINDLELELFAANSHFLHDHVEVLRKLTHTTPVLPAHEPEKLLAENITETPALVEPATPFLNDPTPHIYEPEPVAQESVEVPIPEWEQPMVETRSYPEHSESFTDNEPINEETPAEQKTGPIVVSDPGDDSSVPDFDITPDTGHDAFSFGRRTEPEIIRHELELSEADTFEDEDEQAPEEPTIATQLAAAEPERPLTLNERLSAEKGYTPSTPAQPIKDLKSAITLNDKMLFVRDLFNGYSLAYSEAIEILNRYNNFEDANRFLTSNYATKNNWTDKQATADKFYEILKRRFA